MYHLAHALMINLKLYTRLCAFCVRLLKPYAQVALVKRGIAHVERGASAFYKHQSEP